MRHSLATLVLLLASTPAVSARVPQTVWYVDAANAPPGKGTAGDPFTSLQYALERATTRDGDTLLVASGVYREHVDFRGKAVLVDGSGAHSAPVIDAGGAGTAVTFASGEGAGAVLRGFVVTGGAGTPRGGHLVGGGVLVDGATPRLERLVLSGNRAQRGGALWVSPTGGASVSDCRLEDNHADQWAGAAYGAAALERCTLRRNAAVAAGAVVDVHATACRFEDNVATSTDDDEGLGGAGIGGIYEDCVFLRNEAQRGGALAGAVGHPLTAVQCRFERNVARPAGFGRGGAVAHHADVRESTLLGNVAFRGGAAEGSTLVDCEVLFNEAVDVDAQPSQGGGVLDCDVVRCALRGNRATQGGGAAFSSLARCTVVANVAQAGGGAYGGGAEHASFTANEAAFAPALLLESASSVRNTIVSGHAGAPLEAPWGGGDVRFCLIEAGHPGVGNFDGNPAWYGPAGSDLHLTAGSDAIDAGDPASPRDPDGSVADVGAYPYDGAWSGGAFAYCATAPSHTGCLPHLGWSGSPTLSGSDDFTLRARDVAPGSLGFCIFGVRPTAVAVDVGVLCVARPQGRLAPRRASGTGGDCDAVFEQPLRQAFLSGLGLAPGDLLYLQAWLRAPVPPLRAVPTDGLEVRLLP